MLTLTYITIDEARELNSNLTSLEDEVLNRLVFVSERLVDQYVGISRSDGGKKAFPLEGETTVPDEVKLATALICDGVKAREDFGDPTMGGVIASETGLDRRTDYNKGVVNESWDLSAITNTPRVLLASYRANSAGNSQVSGFSLIGQTNDWWLDPMNNWRSSNPYL